MSQFQSHDYQVLIREGHLDTFGHMNNATYFEILEEARWQMITERGFDLAFVQKHKKGPVVLEAKIKFLREIKLREIVTINTSLVEYSGKLGRMKQTIKLSDGSLASEAVFVFGLFDLSQRKLVDPSPEWLKAIGVS